MWQASVCMHCFTALTQHDVHPLCCVQMVVEKMLAAEGRDRRSMGREAFQAEVWKWKAQYGGFITQQLRRLGASCDWSRERFTLDEGLSGERPCSDWRQTGHCGLCCTCTAISATRSRGWLLCLVAIARRCLTQPTTLYHP